MTTLKAQQAGGRARAISSRKEALERYYQSPNFCKYCGKMLEIKQGQKIAEVRVKNFCNQSCNAKFNNPKRKVILLCLICGKKIGQGSTYCKEHRQKRESFIEIWNNVTKEELFDKRNGYQSARSTIRQHAYKVFEKSKKRKECTVCKYDKHIDVSHIKPVSEFGNKTTLGEINNINNLIAFCPNHHWEFDNKLLNL